MRCAVIVLLLIGARVAYRGGESWGSPPLCLRFRAVSEPGIGRGGDAYRGLRVLLPDWRLAGLPARSTSRRDVLECRRSPAFIQVGCTP